MSLPLARDVKTTPREYFPVLALFLRDMKGYPPLLLAVALAIPALLLAVLLAEDSFYSTTNHHHLTGLSHTGIRFTAEVYYVS